MHQNHQKKEYMVERGSLIRLVISLENNSKAVTKCQIFDSFDTHSRDFFSMLNQVILERGSMANQQLQFLTKE